MSPFLLTCASVLQLQAESYNASTSELDRRHLRRMISVTIRNLTDHPEFGTSMSLAAKIVAEGHNIPLAQMTYDNQKRWDKQRLLFAYEHMVPVKNLMVAILANPSQAAEVLLTAKIVWVTRAENQRLNDLGYAHHRPDPVRCYFEAGIVVL